MGWQSPILLTHPPPQPHSPHSHQMPLTAALGLVALVFIHAELKCSSNECPRLGKGHRDNKDMPPQELLAASNQPTAMGSLTMGPCRDTGLGDSHHLLWLPRGMGEEMGVMRPLQGTAPSASLPVHP